MAVKDLSLLLQKMSPILNDGIYVFCHIQNLSEISPDETIGTFREKEGMTLICSKNYADTMQLAYDFEAAWITLQVHSDLSAVGLTATFSTALANEGISCNVIAGYYHDHIFVPHARANQAIYILKALSLLP